MKNEVLEAVLDELAKAGVRDLVHGPGAKHYQVRWEARGNVTGPRMYSLPTTPSDVRDAQNARSGVRTNSEGGRHVASRIGEVPSAENADPDGASRIRTGGDRGGA